MAVLSTTIAADALSALLYDWPSPQRRRSAALCVVKKDIQQVNYTSHHLVKSEKCVSALHYGQVDDALWGRLQFPRSIKHGATDPICEFIYELFMLRRSILSFLQSRLSGHLYETPQSSQQFVSETTYCYLARVVSDHRLLKRSDSAGSHHLRLLFVQEAKSNIGLSCMSQEYSSAE